MGTDIEYINLGIDGGYVFHVSGKCPLEKACIEVISLLRRLEDRGEHTLVYGSDEITISLHSDINEIISNYKITDDLASI